MMKPRTFSITQLIRIRFSHALDVLTARSSVEKFIIIRQTEAATQAAMVETARNRLYKSVRAVSSHIQMSVPPLVLA